MSSGGGGRGRRGRGGGGEADFAHSLADLMSGVAVTFLVLAAIFMVQASKATQSAREESKKSKALAEQNEMNAQRFAENKERNELGTLEIERMKSALNQVPGVEVIYKPLEDPRLLTMVFRGESVQFESGECALSSKRGAALRDTLRKIFPEICKAVADGLQKSISLEGHTDNQPPLGGECAGVRAANACRRHPEGERCRRQSFEGNVQLSSNRAVYIFNQAREALVDNPELVQCLEQDFLAAGRGPVEPFEEEQTSGLVAERPWQEPRSPAENERNRRVVIKVRVTAAFDGATQGAP